MNQSPPPPIDAGDDWLDAVLREDGRDHRTAYLDDGGFTAQVMAALPAPVALPAWRKPALAALWAAAGIGIAYALPGTVVDVVHEVLRAILGQQVSLAGFATGMAVLGASACAATAYAMRDD